MPSSLVKRHMLQINLSYTFTSKKQTNKHSHGVRTLAVCARTCFTPFGVHVEGAFLVPLRFDLGQLVTWHCSYSQVTEWCRERLGGQLVMADVFIQVRIGILYRYIDKHTLVKGASPVPD